MMRDQLTPQLGLALNNKNSKQSPSLEVRFVRKLREGLLDLSAPDYGRMNVAVAYVKETGLDVLDSMKVKIDRGIVGDAYCEILRRGEDGCERVSRT